MATTYGSSLQLALSVLLLTIVSATYEGYGTVYTLSTPSSGNCNFMSWPEDAATKYAALNVEQWEETMNCGRCAEVSCTDASCAGQSSEIVYIMDQCPGCAYGDLDLSPSVFESITGQSYTKLSIEWKFVDCPVSNNVQYCLKTGSSEFWVAVQPANFVSGVQSLSINGQETSVIDSAYYFLIDGSGESVADLRSVSISLKGVNGEVLEETLSLTADECTNGNSQFSSSGGTSQSTITSTKTSTSSSAPSTPTPTTASPTTAPVTEAPTTSPPTTAPVTTSPPTSPPTTAPVTEAPTTAPVTAAPSTTSPPTSPPTTAPVTDAPTTAPVTAAPSTTAPVTTSPPTEFPTTAPVTEAPSTAPVTNSPSSEAPTTAPVTTSPPTDAPTTAPVTEAPTTPPVTDIPTSKLTTAPPTPTPTSPPTPLLESSADSASIDQEISIFTTETRSATNSTSTDEEPESASTSSEQERSETTQVPATQSTTIQSSTSAPTPASTPSATKASVQEEASSSGGLHSTAAIVGLIAAVCVALGAVVGVTVVVHKKRKLLEERKNMEDRESFASYASIRTPRSDVPVMHSAV